MRRGSWLSRSTQLCLVRSTLTSGLAHTHRHSVCYMRVPVDLLNLNCVACAPKGHRLCFDFSLGKCNLPVQNQRCSKGLHLCAVQELCWGRAGADYKERPKKALELQASTGSRDGLQDQGITDGLRPVENGSKSLWVKAKDVREGIGDISQ